MVEKTGDNLLIVYVGKAGKTIKARCSQHRRGFKGGSKTCSKHSNNIVRGIQEGKSYCVYARHSERDLVLEEKGIPMCTVEEIALIQKFEPDWNKIFSRDKARKDEHNTNALL